MLFAGAPAIPAVDSLESSCKALIEKAKAATTQDRVEELTALAQTCAAAETATIRGALTQSWFNALLQRADALHKDTAKTPAQLEALVTDVEDFISFEPRLWTAHAVLADLLAESDDYARAAHSYQVALDHIQDADNTPTPPPTAVIERLLKRGQEARQLAGEFVPITRTRSGDPAGLGAASVRGVVVNKSLVPIKFHFDQVTFTGDGHLAAEELAEMLAKEAPERVMLVGHTDASGEPNYNCNLSLRRAEAVARFVRERAAAVTAIDVVGRGEYEPFDAADPGSYEQHEIDRLNRRVELLREPATGGVDPCR